MKLMTVEAFRAQAKRGGDPHTPIFRVSTTEPEAQGERSLRFCFSDGTVDRMGDTIDPQGWELGDFLANPVALWAHDSSAPPVGRASDVKVEGARLMGTIEFAPAETYAFADTVYRLLKGKFLRAVSVGFLPVKYSFVENDPDRGWGIDFEKQELLEISVCPVPANANALAEARAKGISLAPLVEWIEATLDGDGKTSIPKAELQRLRKAAKENAMTTRRAPARRANDDDTPVEEAIKATCARGADEECGLNDPTECSVHGKSARAEDDDAADEKAIRSLIKRLLHGRVRRDADGDNDGEQLPSEHHDAVRLAHKCLRTAKAFSVEAAGLHTKAASLLDGVVSSLKADVEGGGSDPGNDTDDKSETDENDDPENKPDPDQKALDLERAAARRSKLQAVS